MSTIIEFLGALMHQVCVLQSADVESVIDRLLTAVHHDFCCPPKMTQNICGFKSRQFPARLEHGQ